MSSNSPAPTNFVWLGDILTFDLDAVVTGVKIQFQKAGHSDWIVILEVDSSLSPPTFCNLPASWGPTGTIWGATRETNDPNKEWGIPYIGEIINI